ncbi:MAG: hypothetical protein WD830_04000 [Chloroflexota bacterium]
MRLTVRAYNVGFGDCILISWDEADRTRHAWFDFGTHHSDDESVYLGVFEDILARTGGRLDLLLISHRHLDHLGGFWQLRTRLGSEFQVERVWHAHVTPEVDNQFKIASDTLSELLPRTLQTGSGVIADVYRNNLAISSKDRMDAIASVFPAASVFQVHRQMDLAASGAMPTGLARMQIEVLAPEQDSTIYLNPIDTSLAARAALDSHFAAFGPVAATRVRASATEAVPLHEAEGAGDEGEDAPPDFLRLADFARLRRQLRSGGLDLLAAVNKSRNNTSIVSRWTWEGVTLLLTGDAELESWAVIRGHGDDFKSTLLKVGHHGSIDASPLWGYEEVFPTRRNTNAVLLSTNPLIFPTGNEVPKGEVLAGWSGRLLYPSRFRRTDAVDRGDAVEFWFDR